MKLKQRILSTLFFIFLCAGASQGSSSITYNFSVLFLAKTCDISVQNEIYIEDTPGSGFVSNAAVKNDNAVADVKLALTNCTTPNIANSKVYIADGNTLSGTTDFFNDDPDSIIGLQITDGNSIFNKNTTALPAANSVVWTNIMSATETKTIKARLRCKSAGCEPQNGDFTASLVFNYYID